MAGGVEPRAARRIRALRSQIAPSPPPWPSGVGWGGAGASGLDAAQRAHFAEHGFVVADDIISASQLGRLQAAARRVRDRVRSGALTHGYFQRSPGEPEVDEADWEIWCIRGLYSAQHAEPVFAELYGSDPLLDYVTSFLECEREELILGDTALMIEPRDADFTSGWHVSPEHMSPIFRLRPLMNKLLQRDFVLGSGPDGEAAEWRAQPDWAASSRTPAARRALQFQIALLETQVLEFVPRSHTRLPNDEERALLLQRENKSNPGVAMPGGAPAPLKPGQVLFFDGGLLANSSLNFEPECENLECTPIRVHSELCAPPAGRRSGRTVELPRSCLQVNGAAVGVLRTRCGRPHRPAAASASACATCD